ncbi:hypothetical protein [Larkinella punicea]|uniref:Uncharacterized protein n=1 Tax=Larkinella punicea TaxID=2315727 RepID=A0A368JKZ8_9BACT|nr:hypothetical protein [Larkinella punicea]RCR68339.1 hypothetical protein DUE52_16395 [Larkinella punicea]
MPHVQHFKSNFDQPAKDDLEMDSPRVDTADRLYLHEDDSPVRNVCFVWEDGRKAFFNYAYLVSVDLVLSDPLNMMLLYFSGQIVTLKGYHLGLLFDLLLNHIPKTVTANHPRYSVDGQTQDSFVTEILVKSE